MTPEAAAHLAAIKSLVAAQHPAMQVYDYGTVPGGNQATGAMPTNFVLVSVERRLTDVQILSGDGALGGWRITTRAVSKILANAQKDADRIHAALDGNRLTVSGEHSNPVQFESDTAPRWDDGYFVADAIYTY